MTEYILYDGSKIFINEDQICTKIENDDNDCLTMSNGKSYLVRKQNDAKGGKK